MVWYWFLPDWRIMFLSILVAMAFLASVGPALWITSLNVKYREFRCIIPFIVQLGLYVFGRFSSTIIPAAWRLIFPQPDGRRYRQVLLVSARR